MSVEKALEIIGKNDKWRVEFGSWDGSEVLELCFRRGKVEFEIKKKPSVLFVLDKWCEGNPNYGTSEWESNLWESLKSSGLTTCETFHFDEYYHLYQQAGDDALIRKCLDYKPDIVCLVIYKIPGSDFKVPTLRTLEIVRHQLNISTVAIWGDLQSPQQVEISKMILPFVDFNVCTASSATVSRIGQPLKTSQKYTYFWVPKDSRCFYNPGVERGIPISYVGSPKPERLSAIDSLRRSGIDVYQTGGERQQHISTEQYAQILMRSKIGLSFSRSGHSHVTNARAFEATLCGAMLLEEEGFETAKLFIPFVDYVPYSSHKDLIEKAKYYLIHDHERQAIADNGCRKSHENYSATRFWRIVLNRALKSTNSETAFDGNTFELTAEILSKLPLSRSLKLRLLNRACSSVVVHTGISGLQRLVKWPFTIISSYTRPAERFLRTLIKGKKFKGTLAHNRKYFEGHSEINNK